MPNTDLTMSATLSYLDSLGIARALQVTGVTATVATEQFQGTKQLITTSIVAINLGPLSAIRLFICVNRDTTNYIELYTSTTGLAAGKLLPGEPALIPLGSDMQLPAAKAHTASCWLEYLVIAL